jgi:hypothetical protein
MAVQTEQKWVDSIPVLTRFEQAGDASRYVPLPDHWYLGMSDFVDSSEAIAEGRYKAVNLAGAGTICSVDNALSGDLKLFVFGGDGAHFAVPGGQKDIASAALAGLREWVGRDLDLQLRVAMISVEEVRAAGFDVSVAFWQASPNVQYAMFMGDGLAWAEARMKSGALQLASMTPYKDPDLTGLSCQWGTVKAENGNIVSLIVNKAPGASQEDFSDIVCQITALLDGQEAINPVPVKGPSVRWPQVSLALQSRINHIGLPRWCRRLAVIGTTALVWLIFKLGFRLGQFDPDTYRREIAANTDFRKFDDGLLMTIDCTDATVEHLRHLLDEASAKDLVRYGMHVQDEALITCVAPSVMSPDHIHFVDGAGGGYSSAAKQLGT